MSIHKTFIESHGKINLCIEASVKSVKKMFWQKKYSALDGALGS